jgi:hypothetical protein
MVETISYISTVDAGDFSWAAEVVAAADVPVEAELWGALFSLLILKKTAGDVWWVV